MESDYILLVEDNPDDQELTVRALKKNNIGNRLVIAQDGVEALEILEREPVSPELILLDLNLPRMNGLEVLQCLRSSPRHRFTPVVILTSSDEERDLLEGYALGANSYVRKPVKFAEFMEAVRVLGLYWLVINRKPNVDMSRVEPISISS